MKSAKLQIYSVFIKSLNLFTDSGHVYLFRGTCHKFIPNSTDKITFEKWGLLIEGKKLLLSSYME